MTCAGTIPMKTKSSITAEIARDADVGAHSLVHNLT